MGSIEMGNWNRSKCKSLIRRIPLSLLLLFGLSQTATADIYVLGASYESVNPDVTATPVGAGDSAGDDTSTDGDTWIALLAPDIGQKRPITSSSTSPGADDSTTNFARGGAEIINTQSGTAGEDRPRDAEEQFDELESYLTANEITLGTDDVFAISAFGNDIVYPYENSTPDTVDQAFIDSRIAEVKRIIEEAISLGYTTVLVANMPRVDLLPGVTSVLTAELLADLKADVDYYNTETEAMLTELKSTHTDVTFYASDIADMFATVTASPGDYGFVDATSTLYDDEGSSTGVDPTTVMWWDGFHPTSAFHQLIADEVGEYASESSEETNSSGGGGALGPLALMILLTLFGHRVLIRHRLM